MHPEEMPVTHVLERLRAEFGPPPKVAIILGSGLGSVVDRMAGARKVSFGDLGLPQSAVQGHSGYVARGQLGGAEVAILSGRVHLYEGWTAHQAVRGVRALKRWGVQSLLVTCSAGGITHGVNPGALVALSDHVNLQYDNPLIGPSWPDGVRFPDLSAAYAPRIRALFAQVAAEQGILWREGVYGAMRGPSYETPAEIRMLRTIGCDLVGMSTVAEMIAAAQCGLEAAAVAVVSNRAAGLAHDALTHDEVMDIAGRAARQLADLFEVTCARI